MFPPFSVVICSSNSFFLCYKPGKFGAIFASIPLPIFAALYCIFFAYIGKSKIAIIHHSKRPIIVIISSTWCCALRPPTSQLAGACGLSFLQFCNLNSFRTKFIVGFSFFMGLSVPQYFNEYTSVAGYGPVHTGARWVCERNATVLLLIYPLYLR